MPDTQRISKGVYSNEIDNLMQELGTGIKKQENV